MPRNVTSALMNAATINIEQKGKLYAMAKNILCFAGSTREESYHRRLAKTVSNEVNELGATATLIELADYSMPIYNGDDEQAHGLPKAAIELQALMREHDALIIASPEYNGFFTPVLKNTIDWMTRPNPAAPDLGPVFKGKVGGIVATSEGANGGLRGLLALRTLLSGIGITVVSSQLAVPAAQKKFSDTELTDSASLKRLRTVVQSVMDCSLS